MTRRISNCTQIQGWSGLQRSLDPVPEGAPRSRNSIAPIPRRVVWLVHQFAVLADHHRLQGATPEPTSQQGAVRFTLSRHRRPMPGRTWWDLLSQTFPRNRTWISSVQTKCATITPERHSVPVLYASESHDSCLLERRTPLGIYVLLPEPPVGFEPNYLSHTKGVLCQSEL